MKNARMSAFIPIPIPFRIPFPILIPPHHDIALSKYRE